MFETLGILAVTGGRGFFEHPQFLLWVARSPAEALQGTDLTGEFRSQMQGLV